MSPGAPPPNSSRGGDKRRAARDTHQPPCRRRDDPTRPIPRTIGGSMIVVFVLPWVALGAFVLFSRDQLHSHDVYLQVHGLIDQRFEAQSGAPARHARQHLQQCARASTNRSAGIPGGIAWMFRDLTAEERNGWVNTLLAECAARYAEDRDAGLPTHERLALLRSLGLRTEAAVAQSARATP